MNDQEPDFFYGGPVFFPKGLRERIYRTIYEQITGELRARYRERDNDGDERLAAFLKERGAPDLKPRRGGIIQRTLTPNELNLDEFEQLPQTSAFRLEKGLKIVLDIETRNRKRRHNSAHFSDSDPPRIRFYFQKIAGFKYGAQPAPSSIENLKTLMKKFVFRVTRTITHECVHYVDYLTWHKLYHTSPEDMGYNRRFRREYGQDPEHALQGREYYPRLMSELQRMHTEVQNFGPVPRSAFRVHVGLDEKPDANNKYGDPRARVLTDYFFDEGSRWRQLTWTPRKFFRRNREAKPGAWRRAVQVMVREAEANDWLTTLGSTRPLPAASVA